MFLFVQPQSRLETRFLDLRKTQRKVETILPAQNFPFVFHDNSVFEANPAIHSSPNFVHYPTKTGPLWPLPLFVYCLYMSTISLAADTRQGCQQYR